MKTIWINAGELSGDMQAAALLTALLTLFLLLRQTKTE